MDSDNTIQQLRRAGVIEIDAETDVVSRSDAFAEEISGRQEAMTNVAEEELTNRFRVLGFEREEADRLTDVAVDPTELLATYESIDQIPVDLERNHQLLISAFLTQIQVSGPPTDGAPESFFPVGGEWLKLFTSIFDKSIVYVWRYDCEPCESVRAALNEIVGDSNMNFGLLSVYGPDSAEFLEQEYNTVGGPTILFMHNGTVDTRLFGAIERSVLESEIGKLQER